MTIDTLWAILIAALPSLASIFGIIAAIVKVLKDNKKVIQPIIDKFEELKKEVEDKTNLEEARAEMKLIISQNAQLREQNRKLLQALNHVVVQDDEEI